MFRKTIIAITILIVIGLLSFTYIYAIANADDIKMDGRLHIGKLNTINKAGNTFIEVNDFARLIGGTASLKDDIYTITRDDVVMEYNLNDKKLNIDKFKLSLDIEEFKLEGSYYLSLRMLTDTLGYGLEWKGNAVNIVSPKNRMFDKGYYSGEVPYRKGFKLPPENVPVIWQGEDGMKGKSVFIRSINDGSQIEVIDSAQQNTSYKQPYVNYLKAEDLGNILKLEMAKETGNKPEDFIQPEMNVIFNTVGDSRDPNEKFSFSIKNINDYMGKEGYKYKILCLSNDEYNFRQEIKGNNTGELVDNHEYFDLVVNSTRVPTRIRGFNIGTIGSKTYRDKTVFNESQEFKYGIWFKYGEYEQYYETSFRLGAAK